MTKPENQAAIKLLDEWFEDEPTEQTPEPEPFKIGDKMTERQPIITATEGPVPGEFDRRIYGETVARFTEPQIEEHCKSIEDLANACGWNHSDEAIGVQIIRQLQAVNKDLVQNSVLSAGEQPL